MLTTKNGVGVLLVLFLTSQECCLMNWRKDEDILYLGHF